MQRRRTNSGRLHRSRNNKVGKWMSVSCPLPRNGNRLGGPPRRPGWGNGRTPPQVLEGDDGTGAEMGDVHRLGIWELPHRNPQRQRLRPVRRAGPATPSNGTNDGGGRHAPTQYSPGMHQGKVLGRVLQGAPGGLTGFADGCMARLPPDGSCLTAADAPPAGACGRICGRAG